MVASFEEHMAVILLEKDLERARLIVCVIAMNAFFAASVYVYSKYSKVIVEWNKYQIIAWNMLLMI